MAENCRESIEEAQLSAGGYLCVTNLIVQLAISDKSEGNHKSGNGKQYRPHKEFVKYNVRYLCYRIKIKRN